MKIRILASVIASSFGLLLGSVFAAPAGGSGPKKDLKNARLAKQPLEKGMTGEEIIKIIGRPQEVKPMEMPKGTSGQAETWIYRREIGTRVIPVATGTRGIPGSVGGGLVNFSQPQSEIVYTNKTIIRVQVTSLLIYDGKLVIARQAEEQRTQY